MKRKYYNLIVKYSFTLLLITGLFLTLIFINTPRNSDDMQYLSIADNYSPEVNYFANQRIGLLFPVILLIKIFGLNLVSYYTYPILMSVVLLAVVFLLTKRLFGLKISIIIGLIFLSSFFRYDSDSATLILPDIPAAAFALLSFYLFTFVNSNKRKKKWVFLIFSSLFGFAAYLCKFPIILFFISIPIYEFLKYRTIKNTILYGLGFLGFWVLECLYYFIWIGDPFSRLKNIMGSGNLRMEHYSKHYVYNTIWEFLLRYPRKIMSTWSGIFVSLFGVIGLIIGVIKREKKIISLAVGAFLFISLHAFTVISFNPLIPNLVEARRYIHLFLVVLTIISAYGIYHLYKYTNRFLFKFIKNKILLKKIVLSFFSILLVLIVIIQFTDIPNRSRSSLLLGRNDDYFIADRILGKSGLVNEIDKIYVYKGWGYYGFKIFHNFGKLYQKGVGIPNKKELFETPSYILYPKNRKILPEYLEPLPSWKYIINYGDIVLVYVDTLDKGEEK